MTTTTRRGPGRPPIGPQLAFLVPIEIREAVERIAQERGITLSDAAREIIRRGLEQVEGDGQHRHEKAAA